MRMRPSRGCRFRRHRGAELGFTYTFRRDPLATDLTYNLQTCSDLVGWTTIASSVAGATATRIGVYRGV